MRLFRKLPDPENVVAGQTFIQRCPVGLSYDSVQLHLTNITDAQLDNLEVVVNGKTIQKYIDAAQLEAINGFYGRPAHTGVVTIFFERPEMISLADQRATILGTDDVQTLVIKGDIDAAATNPAITCYANQSAPAPMGLICKVKQTPITFSASGEVSFDQLVRAARIMSLHFGKADVNNVVIEADGRKIVDASKGALEALQKDAGRTPVTASYTHVDFLTDGDLSQALIANPELVKDLRTLLTLGTTGTVNLAVEYLDGFAGI